MPDSSDAESGAPAREAYTPPKLARHGTLGDLTQGSGTKQIEKASGAEATGGK